MTEQKSSTARTILVIAAIAAFAAVGVTALLVNITAVQDSSARRRCPA